MTKIGLFFGAQTGTSPTIPERIHQELGGALDLDNQRLKAGSAQLTQAFSR